MSSVNARAVVGLARIEAWQLVRSLVILIGFVAGVLLVWTFTHGTQPLWWKGDWAIGAGQMAVSVTVLVAAQLATGRARRDGLAQLYESFPGSVRRRAFGHLAGLVGVVPVCLILAGGASGVFEMHHVLGRPDVAVLVGGVLLVLAAGAIGVAIGVWFPHPLAGVLGGFVWFVPFTQSNRWTGSITWMFPWVTPPFQLGSLPGPVAGYPPAVAHAVELGAIAVLAGAIAVVAATIGKGVGRKRIGPLVVAAAAMAAIFVACGVQVEPIPTGELSLAVSEVAHTGPAQNCTVSGEVRYCLFPGFESKTASLEGPIDDVLAHVPAQHGRTFTVSQYSGLTADDSTLTHGQSAQQVDAWANELQNEPGNFPSSSAIYVVLGSWPSGGQQADDARFDLALGAAEWAVGLPTSSGVLSSGPVSPQCVPLNQAREAIAIWLAAQAVSLPPSPFQQTSRGFNGNQFALVNGTTILTWLYPGEVGEEDGSFAAPGPQTTAAGYLLAQAMTKLPTAHITSVLGANWDSWTSPHATDAQLAAALGISMPAVPTGLPGPNGQTLAPPPGAIQAQPECTS